MAIKLQSNNGGYGFKIQLNGNKYFVDISSNELQLWQDDDYIVLPKKEILPCEDKTIPLVWGEIIARTEVREVECFKKVYQGKALETYAGGESSDGMRSPSGGSNWVSVYETVSLGIKKFRFTICEVSNQIGQTIHWESEQPDEGAMLMAQNGEIYDLPDPKVPSLSTSFVERAKTRTYEEQAELISAWLKSHKEWVAQQWQEKKEYHQKWELEQARIKLVNQEMLEYVASLEGYQLRTIPNTVIALDGQGKEIDRTFIRSGEFDKLREFVASIEAKKAASVAKKLPSGNNRPVPRKK